DALVQVAVALLVDRLYNRFRVVPEVLTRDAAGEVEVLAAVGVPDRGPFRAADRQVRGRNATRHVPLAPGADGCGVLDLLRRHRLNLRRCGLIQTSFRKRQRPKAST